VPIPALELVHVSRSFATPATAFAAVERGKVDAGMMAD